MYIAIVSTSTSPIYYVIYLCLVVASSYLILFYYYITYVDNFLFIVAS